jgi:hypothetical protein
MKPIAEFAFDISDSDEKMGVRIFAPEPDAGRPVFKRFATP